MGYEYTDKIEYRYNFYYVRSFNWFHNYWLYVALEYCRRLLLIYCYYPRSPSHATHKKTRFPSPSHHVSSIPYYIVVSVDRSEELLILILEIFKVFKENVGDFNYLENSAKKLFWFFFSSINIFILLLQLRQVSH